MKTVKAVHVQKIEDMIRGISDHWNIKPAFKMYAIGVLKELMKQAEEIKTEEKNGGREDGAE